MCEYMLCSFKKEVLNAPLYNPDRTQKGIFEDGGSDNLRPAPNAAAIPDRETDPHQ
jgi:hypothetical protein